MTTEEFIEKVNGLSDEERGGLTAHVNANGEPALTDSGHIYTLAYLPRYTKKWIFIAETYSFPGCVLKLMGELAESKYHERENANKETNKMTTKEWKKALKLINCFDSIGYTLTGILFESYFGKGNKYSAQLFKLHDDLIHMKSEFLDQLKRECPDVFLADLFDGEEDNDDME